MTIVLRAASPPSFVDLGAAGVCRVTVGVVLGTFGSGPWKVEYLRPIHQPEGGEHDGESRKRSDDAGDQGPADR